MSNPLLLHHEKLGAKLAPDKTPLSYTDPVEEYWAVKKAAGFVDTSAAGRLVVKGKDRVSFLNGLLTSDLTRLKDGDGQHSALLSHKARVLADLYLYGQPDSILVDTGNATASVVKANLERFVITEDVQIRDVTNDLVQISVQGPRSSQVLNEILKLDIEDLEPLQHKTLGPTEIIHRDRTGQDGYDIVLPSLEAEPVWQSLLLQASDLGIRPVGNQAIEVLRLEAGFPKYGVDVDENTIVLEAGFKDAISFTKGCYMGQEVVARATHIGRVNKQLVKLDIEEEQAPPSKSKLKNDGTEVGFVTSAAYSPGLAHVVALAYANRDFAKEGSRLLVQASNKQIPAVVTKVL